MATSSNYPRSVQIEVHLDAIKRNYQRLRERANSKAFAVIKADAYGHGADAVASYLADTADAFAVVTVGEGIGVRDAGIQQPVLIMQGPQDAADMDAVYEYGLWPALHDEAQIRMVQSHRNALDIEPWLKVDTGMGRLGVSLESADTHLRENALRWRGVMSHLASADDLTNSLTHRQSEALTNIVANSSIESSLANSAGVLGWSGTQRDWARIGIGLYGSHPVENTDDEESLLQAAMSVTAPIVSVKQMAAGQSIGYAETYRCPEAMTVAYVAIGYADGIPRVLNASANVSAAGVRCPIIGRVSMDSIAIDCRPLKHADLPDADLGNMVTIWGPEQPVDRLAAAAGTISYELLTGIRGQRRYTD